MTAPRIVTSQDEEVNRLARLKLGLPEDARVGFELLGRPPSRGDLAVRKGDWPRAIDLGLTTDEDHSDPCDGVEPCIFEAFRIVALDAAGNAAPTAADHADAPVVVQDSLAAPPPSRVAISEPWSPASGRVRVVPPAKQYARIEATLEDGSATLETDGVGGFVWSGTGKFKVDDLPVLAEAFLAAHREWAKKEES